MRRKSHGNNWREHYQVLQKCVPTAGSFALGLGTLPRDWRNYLVATPTENPCNEANNQRDNNKDNRDPSQPHQALDDEAKNGEDDPEHKEEHK